MSAIVLTFTLTNVFNPVTGLYDKTVIFAARHPQMSEGQNALFVEDDDDLAEHLKATLQVRVYKNSAGVTHSKTTLKVPYENTDGTISEIIVTRNFQAPDNSIYDTRLYAYACMNSVLENAANVIRTETKLEPVW